MAGEMLTIALISDVFHGDGALERLEIRLEEARDRGASVAVLPELPLDPWVAATRVPRESDAELPGGPRQQALSDAAREAGIALIGGAIVIDPDSEERFNTCLVMDASGELIHTYRKVHVPEEPGFWETSHYVYGDRPPVPFDDLGMPLGIQICSDINRPEGSQLLAAAGAAAVIAPRSTERATYDRWSVVFRAIAITCGMYVLSVNRPEPEFGVEIGGPSVVVDPDGKMVIESSEAVTVARLSMDRVRGARDGYPGYLPFFPGMYRSAWASFPDGAEGDGTEASGRLGLT